MTSLTQLKHLPSLSASGAQSLIVSAQHLAAKRQLSVAVAIVDSSAHLLAFLRLDHAPLVSIEVAIGKARTAALLGGPSRAFEEMINNGQIAMLSAPGLTPLKGGVPILINGQVCGAVGVSGSSGDNDEALAQEIATTFANV